MNEIVIDLKIHKLPVIINPNSKDHLISIIPVDPTNRARWCRLTPVIGIQMRLLMYGASELPECATIHIF